MWSAHLESNLEQHIEKKVFNLYHFTIGVSFTRIFILCFDKIIIILSLLKKNLFTQNSKYTKIMNDEIFKFNIKNWQKVDFNFIVWNFDALKMLTKSAPSIHGFNELKNYNSQQFDVWSFNKKRVVWV